MSAIFQRPLCEMGRAYDYAFRPIVGDADIGAGGPCDDRPKTYEICSAAADPIGPGTVYRRFLLCSDHLAQLRRYDDRVKGLGRATRFGAGPVG